jgi:rhodanese-related sulfurtransferase
MYKTLAIALALASGTVLSADNISSLTHPQTATSAQYLIPTVTPQVASDAVTQQHALIVDVRETNEVTAAHIPGAINIPLSQLKQRLTELDNYKNSEIITQCRTGGRSAEALKILTASGFTNVKNLEGGILAWEKAGLKTEKKCC